MQAVRSGDVDSADDLVRPALALDAVAFDDAVRSECTRLGSLRFIDTGVSALLQTLAKGRSTHGIGLRHELFARERITHTLRAMRSSLASRGDARRGVVAALGAERPARPLETTLWLERITAVLAAAGWRAICLGVEYPIGEIVAAAAEWRATAVVTRMPRASAELTHRLRRLRERLGRTTILVATGEGAPAASRGLIVISSLPGLDSWARGGPNAHAPTQYQRNSHERSGRPPGPDYRTISKTR